MVPLSGRSNLPYPDSLFSILIVHYAKKVIYQSIFFHLAIAHFNNIITLNQIRNCKICLFAFVFSEFITSYCNFLHANRLLDKYFSP